MTAMTPQERLQQHVDRFNASVRAGSFDEYGELFADDGRLKLLGGGWNPGTTADGPEDIAAACERTFTGRRLRVLTVIAATAESATFDYAWDAAPKTVAGQMILKWRDGKVTCLTVTLS